MVDAPWVPVAEVTKPHGIRGEVRVRLYNADSELLEAGLAVCLRLASGRELPSVLEFVRDAGPGGRLVKLPEFDNPEDAAVLRGAVISVQRDAFEPAGDGEFYVCDVVGATVLGPSGELGTVEDIVSYPGSEVMIVRTRSSEGRETVEVPLVDSFIESVDPARKVVVGRPDILEFFV